MGVVLLLDGAVRSIGQYGSYAYQLGTPLISHRTPTSELSVRVQLVGPQDLLLGALGPAIVLGAGLVLVWALVVRGGRLGLAARCALGVVLAGVAAPLLWAACALVQGSSATLRTHLADRTSIPNTFLVNGFTHHYPGNVSTVLALAALGVLAALVCCRAACALPRVARP